MSLQLPTPVPAYPLPNNKLVASPEEWAAEMSSTINAERVKRYIDSLPADTSKQKATRDFNTIMGFLHFEAVSAARQQASGVSADSPLP